MGYWVLHTSLEYIYLEASKLDSFISYKGPSLPDWYNTYIGASKHDWYIGYKEVCMPILLAM
jgi:hypothetical protein